MKTITTKLITVNLFIIIILFCNMNAFTQSNDINKYTLKINKCKTKKEDNKTYYLIKTTLTNNSKETINFFSMSCSWQFFYLTDNSDLEIKLPMCDKNVPIVLSLAPKQVKKVELWIHPKTKKSKLEFKIAFILMLTDNKHSSEFNYDEEIKKAKIIWSNKISL